MADFRYIQLLLPINSPIKTGIKAIVSKEFNEVWGLEEEQVLFELDGWKYYFTAYEETTIETLRGFKQYKLDRIDRTARIYRNEIDGSEQDVQ